MLGQPTHADYLCTDADDADDADDGDNADVAMEEAPTLEDDAAGNVDRELAVVNPFDRAPVDAALPPEEQVEALRQAVELQLQLAGTCSSMGNRLQSSVVGGALSRRGTALTRCVCMLCGCAVLTFTTILMVLWPIMSQQYCC